MIRSQEIEARHKWKTAEYILRAGSSISCTTLSIANDMIEYNHA